MVTLFLSCLLLTISFLPVIWFPWLYHLTGRNTNSGSSDDAIESHSTCSFF